MVTILTDTRGHEHIIDGNNYLINSRITMVGDTCMKVYDIIGKNWIGDYFTIATYFSEESAHLVLNYIKNHSHHLGRVDLRKYLLRDSVE